MVALANLEPATEAIQDYVKAIYALERRGEETVSTNALAERLGVTPGSASAMVKRLAARGLVEHAPYRGVALTPQGVRVALEVLRHHRLLETYLAEELGMPWERVHAEAEVLEHVLSEELEALIAAKLDHPTHDPHGDPIPSAELELDEKRTRSLGELEAGARGTFVRVSDSDPAMLRYLAERAIAPGADFEVVERQPFGGPLFVRIADRTHALGGALAAAMRVELNRVAEGDAQESTRKEVP
jgi:DtxR family Mn-dependent transcriptional regulator